MNTSVTENNVTDDAFLGGRLQLLQSRDGLRSGLDAVFLAAAIPLSQTDPMTRILDVGTGCGVVGLCALSRCSHAWLAGIDTNEASIALGKRNAERNDMDHRAQFHVGDVRAIADTMASCGLKPNSFDHVVANPPFFESGTVQRAPNEMKDRANVMAAGELDLWVRFMTNAAKAGGTFTMIHKTDALNNILSALAGRFGGVRVFPLFPRASTNATRVIVQGHKGSRSPLRICPGLVLHKPDGAFTDQANAILRGGNALSLDC